MQHVLALRKHLEEHSEFVKHSEARYLQYVGEGIELLDFQTEVVEAALAARPGIWSAEMATGIGKTIIAARVALEKLKEGPVLYVCASPTALLTDSASSIPAKFMQVAKTLGKKLVLGDRNDLSRANDISFMTPGTLVRRLKKDPEHTEMILRGLSCLVVDEAHHFPQDRNKNLKIYGRIYDIARNLVPGLTLAMTGTWDRLDRKVIMGSVEPDIRMSVQAAVDLGRCPEIYGIQVILDITAKKVGSHGDMYDYHLTGDELAAYHQGVAQCLVEVYKKYPVPFAAFARTQNDAARIASAANTLLGCPNVVTDDKGNLALDEENGVQVLTSRTPQKERRKILDRILSGQAVGYITCAVGEEALDLPPLEVIHLIRRTKSFVRNAQAIGRALRLHPDKPRALVVDYQMMVEGVIGRFVGLNLEDYLDSSQSRTTRAFNGGPLVTQPSYPEAAFEGAHVDLAEERALVIRSHMSDQQLRTLEIQEQMAEQERQWVADRPQRESDMGKLISGFRSMFPALMTTSGPFDFQTVEIPLKGDLQNPRPLAAWLPVIAGKDLGTYISSGINKYRHASYWYDAHMDRLGRASCTTLGMLFQCAQQDEEQTANEWALHAAPYAVIVKAMLQKFSRMEHYLLEVPSMDATPWRDDELRRQLMRELGGMGVEAIQAGTAACTEVFQAMEFPRWHHTQTDTLPGPIMSDRVCQMFRVRGLKDLGALAGLVWGLVRAQYQLVTIRFRPANTTLKIVEPPPEPPAVKVSPEVEAKEAQWQKDKETIARAKLISPQASECLSRAMAQPYTHYGGSAPKKADLLLRAQQQDYPSHTHNKTLHQMFLHYINPKSKIYDKLFVAAIRSIDATWLGHCRQYNRDGTLRSGR
jgi:superfamily II DNA or RNA helicase